MTDVTPFARASGGSIADMEVETDEDVLVLSGTIRIERDRRGLDNARRLADLLARAVADLEAADLPDRADPPPTGRTIPNPF